MNQNLFKINIKTSGQGLINITKEINNWLKEINISCGIICISVSHTSCSLTVNENADPDVLNDLCSFFQALVPYNEYTSNDGNKRLYKYRHSQEGIDDMPAHIKTALTNTSISLSFNNGELLLGQWQSVYIWEHRLEPMNREIILNAIGS
tara:strand:- start:3793 stop:4242 length:450 start_codon:yes stop_codon:yes gene_type:complete